MSEYENETPAEDAGESETSESKASSGDINVTDVRQSAYAPGDSIESFDLKHGSIEDINQRAEKSVEQYSPKGGA